MTDVLGVRLIGSSQTVTQNLLRYAAPPTDYRWSTTSDSADLSILVVPHFPDPTGPERLSTLRRRDYGNLFIFSQEDRPLTWAPGIFTSLDKQRASSMFAGGFYVPEHHFEPYEAGRLLDAVAQSTITQDHLWSFVGSVRTYPALRSRIIGLPTDRAVVCDTSGWNRNPSIPGFAEMARQAIIRYVSIIARSKFVLAPRGVGPSSIRLFEAMRAGRTPVIISDSWLAPPFIDWDSCSVRIPEAHVCALPAILREREPEAEAIGLRARDVWQQHFSPENAIHHIVASCLELHDRRPSSLSRLRCIATACPRRDTLRRIKVLLRAELEHRRDGHASRAR